MKFKLKPNVETFTIMSGPDEGKTYQKGRAYNAAPKGYEDRFEEIAPPEKAVEIAKKEPDPKSLGCANSKKTAPLTEPEKTEPDAAAETDKKPNTKKTKEAVK